MTLETSHDLPATTDPTSDISAQPNSMLSKSSHDTGASNMSAIISHDQEHVTSEDGANNMTENISRDQEGVTNEDRVNDMSENMSHDQEHVPNNSSAVVSQGSEEVESFIKTDDSNNDKAPPGNAPSLLTRLKTDLPFRRRYMHTLCVCWGFIVLGWMVGLMGPSFPDLRLIVQKDIDTASWLFTTFSIGYLLGSLIAGIIYDRFNKLLLIFYSIVCMAVTTGIIPWCKQFPLMLVVRFLSGIGAGGLDTGANADVVSIWDEEGRPYMQAAHFCFAFGGILSPLVSEPFLAKKECLPDSFNETEVFYINSTEAFNGTSDTNVTDGTPATNCTVVYGETYIHFSYLISAILIITAAIPFLIMYINTKIHKKPHVVKADKSNMERPDKLPIKLKLVLLALLSALMLMYCAVEDTYAGFLMTYCIKQLGWAKSDGSIATSVYWAAFSFGRFAGIFLIKRFKPVQLLFVYLIMLILSFLAIFITTILLTPVIWVFIPFAGFSMSIVFPCIFTWTEESILNVTGKISSMFLISASSGLMLNPLILGFLIDNFTPLSFVYLLFSESVICLLLFLTIFFLVKKYVENIAKNIIKDSLSQEIVVLQPLTENSLDVNT